MSDGPVARPVLRASTSLPMFRDGAARLLHLGGNRAARVGLAGVALTLVVALMAPWLAPHDPLQTDLARSLAPPSWEHLLGTDHLGRDVLSRLFYGARVSLSIALLSVALSVGLGVALGAVAGFFGGVVDTLVMRTVDLALAIPRLVLLVTVIAIFQPSIATIVLLLALTQWPAPARLVRAEILSLKKRDFILAARGLGYSRRRILFRHLLPNATSPVLVAATLGIAHTVILEAGLAFLGLGVPLSWGTLLLAGRANLITGAWWLSTFPGLAIALVAIAFNLLGDGLRDALDPRQGEGG
ncbi:MAG TPA: ABC transporter permease [Longimicrobiales bacterium]|nr:ABC transporter permease [Longimicrobiales bacterium]